MPLSLIGSPLLRARPQPPVPNCRERRGPPPASRSVILPFMRPVCQTPALYFREYCEKFQMLPPIEFFMGMLVGGLLGYFVATMAISGREERHR
jgi:hypothetical protein